MRQNRQSSIDGGRRKSVLRSATMKWDMAGIAHLDSLYFNRIAIKSGAIAGGIYYDKDRQAARSFHF